MANLPDLQLRGKIGGVILYVRNGKQCMRSIPSQVKNPRTPKQMKGRRQFGEVSKFASFVLKTLIHPYWNIVAKKINRIGYNYFVTSNLPAFISGDLAAEKLILCPDNGLIQENFVLEKQGVVYSLSWKSRPNAKSAKEVDDLCILIYSKEEGVVIRENMAKRGDCRLEIEVVGGTEQHYFIFWKREGLWSESKWVFSVNVQE